MFFIFLAAWSQGTRENDAASQKLRDLSEATSLKREGVPPWHLRVSFTVNKPDGAPLDSGTAEVYWTAQHREVRTITSGVFQGKLPSDDAAFAAGTLRELYLVQQLLDQTIEPLAGYRNAHDLIVAEETERIQNLNLLCLKVSRHKQSPPSVPTAQSTKFCTSVSEPTMLRLADEPGVEVIRNRLAIFQKTNVALDNVIGYSGKLAIKGHTDILELSNSDPEGNDSQSQPSKESSIHLPNVVMAGRKLAGKVPEYPYEALDHHVAGSVVLYALIDKAGVIKSLTVIGSADYSLTRSALTAVKTWTYAPYLLDGQPTEVGTTITVSFNLSLQRS